MTILSFAALCVVAIALSPFMFAGLMYVVCVMGERLNDQEKKNA